MNGAQLLRLSAILMTGPPAFAAALDVPVQELLQVSKPVAVEPAHKPSRKLLRRMEQIERLPRRKQTALLTTIDTFLENSPAS